MKLAIIANYFGSEEKSIPKIAKIGFKTIEVNRKESINIGTDKLIQICSSYNIDPHSIMGSDRDLISTEKAKRKRAVKNLKDNIRWANEIGAAIMETVPGYGTRNREKDEILAEIIRVLKEIGKYAEDYGITLAIEPCNKSETFYMSRILDAVEIARKVGLDSIKVMGDTYHMNIEERNPAEAILNAKNWIVHMHLSDNDRLPPGLGRMDLKSIVNALHHIDYQGSLSLSEIKGVPDRETAAKISYEYVKCLVRIAEIKDDL